MWWLVRERDGVVAVALLLCSVQRGKKREREIEEAGARSESGELRVLLLCCDQRRGLRAWRSDGRRWGQLQGGEEDKEGERL